MLHCEDGILVLNHALPSFLSPPLSPAVNSAPGCTLKVACVSAAVSDESVAGDSGVYEASVQRWVPESWLSGNSEYSEPRPPQVCGRGPQEGMPECPHLPPAVLFGAVVKTQTVWLLMGLEALQIP